MSDKFLAETLERCNAQTGVLLGHCGTSELALRSNCVIIERPYINVMCTGWVADSTRSWHLLYCFLQCFDVSLMTRVLLQRS